MFSNHSSQSTLSYEKIPNNDCVNTYLRIRPCKERSPNYGIFKDTLWVQKNGRNNDRKSVYYSFNSIFEENTSQEELFKSTTLPLVKEFLLGRNNLIFSYGITSSGKSYTMRGTSNSPGLIPHSLISIFDALGPSIPSKTVPEYKISKFCDVRKLDDNQRQNEENLQKRIITMDSRNFSEEVLSQISIENLLEKDETFFTNNDECSIWISYFEIYNEKFFDLLRPGTEMQVVTSEKNYYLRDVTNVYVTSAVDAFAVFLKGQENLHMDATNLNEHSSRSHSVFTLSLLKTDRSTKQTSISKLCFGDLAGNERLKKIGLGKIAETTNINKSLMSLSRCIQELKNKSSVIPVRDSNLTKVFQPYLTNTGGKMNLIYNLNPNHNLFEESSNSLDFCKASQRITQKQIDEFRQTIVSKENTPVKVEAVVQKMRKSISFLSCDTLADRNELNELKKQLEECAQQIEQLQKEKHNIFIKGDQLLTNAKKAHKADIKMREECIEMLGKMYNEKVAHLEEQNNKLVQENFDLNEKLSMYEINEQSYLEKIKQLEEENERLRDINNQAVLSENDQKPQHDEIPVLDTKEAEDTVNETPDFNKKITSKTNENYPLSSTVLETPSCELSSMDRYRTPIKPKRKGAMDDSTVELYLYSAKKAREPTIQKTPERKKSKEIKRIELTRTAQKRLATDTSISDVRDQVVQVDGEAPTLGKRRYNFRSKTKFNLK